MFGFQIDITQQAPVNRVLATDTPWYEDELRQGMAEAIAMKNGEWGLNFKPFCIEVLAQCKAPQQHC
jgi:hypothetical protein